MRKSSLIGMLALAIISQTGCSICAPGYIDDYGAVGGKWERINPTDGRVGSILSDSEAEVGMPGGVPADGDVYYETMDDGYGEVIEGGDVRYDDSPIYEFVPEEIAPYESPSDEGVIILGDQF